MVGTNTAVFFPLDTTVTVMQLSFFFHQQPNEISFYRSGFFFYFKEILICGKTQEFEMMHRRFSFME